MDFTKCPYNPSHTFDEEKYTFHILRCKDGLKFSHLFEKCRFNPLHIFRREDVEVHETICPDKFQSNRNHHNLLRIAELYNNPINHEVIIKDEEIVKKSEEKSIVKEERSFPIQFDLNSIDFLLDECSECQLILSQISNFNPSKSNMKLLKKLLKKEKEMS